MQQTTKRFLKPTAAERNCLFVLCLALQVEKAAAQQQFASLLDQKQQQDAALGELRHLSAERQAEVAALAAARQRQEKELQELRLGVEVRS